MNATWRNSKPIAVDGAAFVFYQTFVQPPKLRSRNRFSRVVAIVFLVLASLFAYWRTALYFRVKNQIAAIRSAGLPAGADEVNDWLPEVPGSENGALVLGPALASLQNFYGTRSNSVSEMIKLRRDDDCPPELRAAAESYLKTNDTALAEVEAALRHSKFQYPIDYSYGASTLLPHLADVKQGAQNFRFRTMLQARDKNPAWTNSVLLQLKLAETLEGEPTVIAGLVRIAILDIAARSAEYALNRSTADPAAARVLQMAFLRAARTNPLPNALIGERAMIMPYFRMSLAEMNALGHDRDVDSEPSSPRPVKPSGHGFAPLTFTGFFERDLEFFLNTMDKSIAASRLPPPASLQLTNILEVGNYARSHLYIMSGMMLPSLSRSSIKIAHGMACTELAATAFALENFRQKNNRYPESLTNLVPEFLDAVPIDPFDGQPIRYRASAQGFMLYSVDVDGRDDNAADPPARRKMNDSNTYDLTFKVERP